MNAKRIKTLTRVFLPCLLSALLAACGIPDQLAALVYTPTPTATATFTPTSIATPTAMPTITLTSTDQVDKYAPTFDKIAQSFRLTK